MAANVYDFVVVVSYVGVDGVSVAQDYFLSQFQGTAEKTAYKALKDKLFADCGTQSVNWVSVNMVCGQQLITSMQGCIEWFNKVEYFQKYIGSMGGELDAAPASYGFIDMKNGIRVEFEYGAVMISEAKGI